MIDTYGSVIDLNETPFFVYHGWLMWTSWGILGLVQLLSNRYLKAFWLINRWIHTISGLAILILTLTYGLLAMKNL
jgi:hypothetical protein